MLSKPDFFKVTGQENSRISRRPCPTDSTGVRFWIPLSVPIAAHVKRLVLRTRSQLSEKIFPSTPEQNAITFSQEYRLANMTREKLIVRSGEIYEPERPTDREFLRFCSKSLKIRQISAGGCAACELDFNVLGTLAWDMGRFGIQVVASPRHADCILVTGPVSKNMLLALKKGYEAAPHPVWVIACGACAISGGIYQDSPETMGGIEEILKPDLYVPGCPPHPTTLLEGMLRLMNRK